MKRHSHKHQNLSLAEALAKIEASSYRMTRPRKILLEAIFKQTKPFSARSLEKILGSKGDCDPVTIYRTLPVLVDLGIIEKCDFADEMAHYEVASGLEGHHHHHIVCKSCKKVEPLDFCVVDGQEQILRKLGYKDLTHRLEFTGTCPDCV